MGEQHGWRAIKSTASTIFGCFLFYLPLLKVHIVNMPLHRTGHMTKCQLYHYCSQTLTTKVLQLITIFRDIWRAVIISPHLYYLRSATFPSLTSVWWSSYWFMLLCLICSDEVNGLTRVPRVCDVPAPFGSLQ